MPRLRARKVTAVLTTEEVRGRVAPMPALAAVRSDDHLSAPTLTDAALRQAVREVDRPIEGVQRLLDLAIAVPAVIVGLPIVALVGLTVLVANGPPVFYRQVRLGRNGRPFHLVKFRTMAIDADRLLRELLVADEGAREQFLSSRKLEWDPRVHRIGRFLRRTKLDELPQLWNVLRGHMSIVGPRPVVPEEVVRYGPYGQLVFAVRPGLTGPWQVADVDPDDYAARISIDLAYVQSHRIRDMVALAVRTPKAILRRARTEEFA